MRQFTARTTLTSLVILGGIVVGAAPIDAQDIAPPDTTSTTPVRGSYVAPPTTTTTVPPRDVQAPSTTIPAVPTPPSLPPEVPKDIKNPCEEKPELCEIPPFPTFPPTPAPAPPSLPPDGPKDVTNPCEDDPELCEIPPFPSIPPPQPAPARPTLPRNYAAVDAAALRDGLRIYRDARQVAAFRLLVVIRQVLGHGAGSITTGGLKGEPIGTTCMDSDCVGDFANYCWDLGGVVAGGEGEGGYLCKFYEESVPQSSP
jgi:hypothetical protein